jgi:hypothetical protein
LRLSLIAFQSLLVDGVAESHPRLASAPIQRSCAAFSGNASLTALVQSPKNATDPSQLGGSERSYDSSISQLQNDGLMKNLPLEGITVLELGHSVAAPFAGEILGDLGADVIKVEKRNGGDDARKWAPPYWHGISAVFQSLNRNKRSVVVELRDPAENAH